MPTRHHWTSNWRGGLALVALCAAFQLPGLTRIPPVDRDEARFAGASLGVATADNWQGRLVPRFDGRWRLNKPPLIYWAQAASARALGTVGDPASGPCQEMNDGLLKGGIWAYRVPSILAAILAALVTWRFGLGMFAPEVAWLGGALLGCCVLISADARQARSDELLLLWTTCAQALLWVIWRARRRPPSGLLPSWPVVGLWVCVALGMMTKGPVTPFVAGTCAIVVCVLNRDAGLLRRVRPVWGLLIVTAVVAPWVIAVGRVVGWDTLGSVAWAEVVGRSTSAKEGHWGPPGYYLLLLPILFWPGSFALAPACRHAWRRGLRFVVATDRPDSWWKRFVQAMGGLRGGRDAELFLIAWLVPTWLLFELVATKLPHYTLPTYPAVALLCARGFYAGPGVWRGLSGTHLGRAGVIGWFVLTVVLCVGLPPTLAVVGALTRSPGVWIPFALLLAAELGVTACLGLALRRLDVRRAVVCMFVLGGITMGNVFDVVAPHLDRLWLSSRAMAVVCQADPKQEMPVAAVGYVEDSLVFLSRGRIDRLSRREVEPWLAKHRDALLLVGDRMVRDNLEVAGTTRRVGKPLAGWNYSKGKWVTIDLDRVGQAAPAGQSEKTRQ